MRRLSESGVLTKRDMQNMQGGVRTGIENRCPSNTMIFWTQYCSKLEVSMILYVS